MRVGCVIHMQRLIIQSQLKFVFSSALTYAFFSPNDFISVGNSSLKGMTAPWWLFTMCVQLEETDAVLAVGLSKTS